MNHEQEIKNMIQNHAKKCIAMECDYDLYEDGELYEHIAFNYCDTFEQEHQEHIYPSIIRYYPSKELTLINNTFGRNRRRSKYDTIVAVIMLEAKQLLMENIRLRDNQQIIFQQHLVEQPPNA
jgi:hypothetical protein